MKKDNLWCVAIMAAIIIVLTWLSSSAEQWSRIVVTILAVLILARAAMKSCCK